MAGRRSWLVVAVLAVLLVTTPGSAAAFGTIEGDGQNREHERITRAALACAGAGGSEDDCFQPRSIDLFAGHGRGFGAVGAPDKDELSNPAAHCDNVDFLVGDYPRTRAEATGALLECVDQLRYRFGRAVDVAAGLLDAGGEIIPEEVEPDPDCALGDPTTRGPVDPRAKCATLEELGRAVHGAQDFYAHSNWADVADPTRPVGPDNPPGLDRPGPSPMLDLRSDAPPDVPAEFSGGCFALRDQVPGVGECTDRVTHAGLNKDRGMIDPATGDVTAPTTPRGMVEDNFAKAVTGAIAETRRQWEDFRAALTDRYGRDRAAMMICAVAHDDPLGDCPDRAWGRYVAVVAAVLVLALAATAVIVRRVRRRS